MKSRNPAPHIYNLYKPARCGSFDLVRDFKRRLGREHKRVGHFGTLDPFACGVLLVGVNGAARLNDLIHAELPKTYLAVGKLGVQTRTGDWEGELLQSDQSDYSRTVIARFEGSFLQERFAAKFLGDYWQAPPIFSAAKHEGKRLHEWAREGVEIKKEPVRRLIHRLQVVRYSYPYLSVRVTVSSGTYVRVLFEDLAQELGTIGSLIALRRESIGPLRVEDSQSLGSAELTPLLPEDVLRFPRIDLPESRTKAFLNGLPSRLEGGPTSRYAWVIGPDRTNWGLAEAVSDEWKTRINFRAAL